MPFKVNGLEEPIHGVPNDGLPPTTPTIGPLQYVVVIFIIFILFTAPINSYVGLPPPLISYRTQRWVFLFVYEEPHTSSPPCWHT